MTESRFSIAGLSSWLWSFLGPESEGLSQEEMPPALEGRGVVAIKPVPVPIPPAGTPRPLPKNITHVDFFKGKRLPTRPVPWPIAVGAVVTGAMLTYRLDQDPHVILHREVIDPGLGLSAEDRLLRAALDGVMLAKAKGDEQAVEAIKDGWVALAEQGIGSQYNFLEAVRSRYPTFSDEISALFFAEGKTEDSRYQLLRRLWLAAGTDEADARRNAKTGALPEISGLSKILPQELSVCFLPVSVSVYDPEFVAKERRISADTPTIAVDLDGTLIIDETVLNQDLVQLLVALKQDGVRIALWTAADKSSVMRQLERHPILGQILDPAITAENYASGDPDDYYWDHLEPEKLQGLYHQFSPTPDEPFSPEEFAEENYFLNSSATKEAGLLGYLALIDDLSTSRRHATISPLGRTTAIDPFFDQEDNPVPISVVRAQIDQAIAAWRASREPQ